MDINSIFDTESYKQHNSQYESINSFINEIEAHKKKTIGAKTKNGGDWDNLWKPGHLHGNWLENNGIIKSAVDIGSGTGWFVNYLVSEYNFKNVIGIEPSESAKKTAISIYPESVDKINYITGFAEIELNKIKLENPTLFTTFIVLSHIEDGTVIKILEAMDKCAPENSVFIFNENFDNEFHMNLWHCRSRQWWESHLPNWTITYDERPRPELQYYKQGLMGIKNKSISNSSNSLIKKNKEKVKIAFHDNQLCERGTTVSLYDYAYYNKHYLGNESIIMYYGNDHRNVPEVIEKFKKEFTLRPYINWNQDADSILKEEECDILYMQKAGEWDGKMASSVVCKTVVHCVFNTQYKHGEVYAKISDCFGSKYPVVNYMVNLPEVSSNLREELNIPQEAIVFGRHGGMDQFNIDYVHRVIDEITDKYPNVYFLFVNTNKFCKDKKNIIHQGKIVDLNKKVEFINTCNAMIHARQMGETFGAAVAEFSIKNKPVITCKKGYDIEHLNILKEKCFTYNNGNELTNIFENFIANFDEIKNKDWNAYADYSPQNIMDKFNEVFIKPCIKK